MKYSVIVNYNTMSLNLRTMPERAAKQQMNSRFDLHTKGLLSLAVMLMFTVALIAGQARANLPAEASASSDFAPVTRMSAILDAESLQHIESLPYVVAIILALPIDIELNFNGLTLRTGAEQNAGSDDASVE
jgi:hypothetical protein